MGTMVQDQDQSYCFGWEITGKEGHNLEEVSSVLA
jgi:hypothetical protein